MSRSSKRKQNDKAAPARPAGGLVAAASWPLYEVLISRDWSQQAALVTVLIARRSPKDKIAAASFLVDLACLGVKDAAVRLYPLPNIYRQDMRQRLLSTQPMIPADLDLVAKIIDAGVGYAEQLGFRPDPVFHQAKHLLAGACPDACPISIPLGGPEGKPLFVAGPYDDARHIVDHLMRRVGAGNFHYIVQLGAEEHI